MFDTYQNHKFLFVAVLIRAIRDSRRIKPAKHNETARQFLASRETQEFYRAFDIDLDYLMRVSNGR